MTEVGSKSWLVFKRILQMSDYFFKKYLFIAARSQSFSTQSVPHKRTQFGAQGSKIGTLVL